jgi:RNA-directed DNA polymerase
MSNFPEKRKQMNATLQPKTACALFNLATHWDIINWNKVQAKVRKLQMRIAQAVQKNRSNKVRALQWTLTHSFYARLLAVKRVTTNKGKRTPGVDRILWKSSQKKINAALSLKRRGYSPLPLRRVYIPKKNGKLRPLGIPTMRDRAMQALYAIAVLPVAETTADRHSYGFRPQRSCADAIEQCHAILSTKNSARWVLEGDIRGCFDNISHQWMLDNITMDKKILQAWLKAGYIEKNVYHNTNAGTPQGGIISPILANLVLDGLENACTLPIGATRQCRARLAAKVNVVRYADDFIVTASSKELLEQKILPAIKGFLSDRGLVLSDEKTKLTMIENGFDFLGQTIRKFDNKLIIKPSMKSVKAITNKARETIKSHWGDNACNMIQNLNPLLRGWSNYHKHVSAHQTFSRIDHHIFHNLWKWARRQHQSRNKHWITMHYFCLHKGWKWWFFATQIDAHGEKKNVYLYRMGQVKTTRHIKIRTDNNIFDPKHTSYFLNRKKK